MRVLIVGCGYVGSLLAHELAARGHEVSTLRRSATAPGGPLLAGVQSLQADITRPELLAGLPRDFDWVVNCAASGGGTAEDYRQLYLNGNGNLIHWLREAPVAKFIYTSSTSVYGQNDGSLVTEADAVLPGAETSRVLVEAEQLLLAAQARTNFPAVILRVAGIYGPGRGYWLRQFLHGEARLDGDGTRYLNMIHLSDVAGAILAALERAPTGRVFNVVDNEPVRQRDLFAWLGEHLGQPMPLSAPADAEAARKRGITSKRVSNERMRCELGYEFQFPTFREGYLIELARMDKLG